MRKWYKTVKDGIDGDIITLKNGDVEIYGDALEYRNGMYFLYLKNELVAYLGKGEIVDEGGE